MRSDSPLDDGLKPHRDRMTSHPLFHAVGDIAALRLRMERHVFAVYDVMRFLKTPQERLDPSKTAWRNHARNDDMRRRAGARLWDGTRNAVKAA